MAAPLKDFIDRELVEELAGLFVTVDADFDAKGFIDGVTPALHALELKQRVEAVARGLHTAMGGDYRRSLRAVVSVCRADPGATGWAAWPLASVVELFGVDDPEASLPAMEHITKRMSCEFAVRPFLRDHFDLTYAQLESFASNDDEAVRRLPSEGMRPRLPWGMKVQRLVDDPAPGLGLLERLRHDPSETVRRSVANHLNDVAKAHPDLVVATAARWLREPETSQQMVSHGLRTLVKHGDAGALEALGFTTDPELVVEEFSVDPGRVEMGDHIVLTATLRSSSVAVQKLVVDFVIHHVNASGETSPKVFKWKNVVLQPGETLRLDKRRLIQQASTRTYRAGTHRVELQVAGSVVADARFDVVLSS